MRQPETHLEFIVPATYLVPVHNNLHLPCSIFCINWIPLFQTVRNSLNISQVEYTLFVLASLQRILLLLLVTRPLVTALCNGNGDVSCICLSKHSVIETGQGTIHAMSVVLWKRGLHQNRQRGTGDSRDSLPEIN